MTHAIVPLSSEPIGRWRRRGWIHRGCWSLSCVRIRTVFAFACVYSFDEYDDEYDDTFDDSGFAVNDGMTVDGNQHSCAALAHSLSPCRTVPFSCSRCD